MKNYLICVTKRVDKIIGIKARNEKESKEKVVKLTEEIIEKNKEEQIKVSCKKCRTSMLLDDIIHQ